MTEYTAVLLDEHREPSQWWTFPTGSAAEAAALAVRLFGWPRRRVVVVQAAAPPAV